MFKQLIVIPMVAACPALALAQTCHTYVLPATLHSIPYEKYASMARAESQNAPATPAAYLARAEALQASLCALDRQADGIGPLPETFHYAPSESRKGIEQAMSEQSLKDMAEHGTVPAQKESARNALQHPLMMRMTMALVADVDYRQQAVTARYVQAGKAVPEDLNATVQAETLQAIQAVQDAQKTSDSSPAASTPASQP